MRFVGAVLDIGVELWGPGDEAVTHILRHALVFLKLFQKDLSMEGQDLLKVAENRLGFAPGINKKNRVNAMQFDAKLVSL